MSRVTNVDRGGTDATGNDGYGYDYTGQLTSATYSSWNGGGTRSVNYSQDDLGNRNQVNDNGSIQGYSPNGSYLNQYVSAPSGAVSNNSDHQTIGYAGLSYSYRDNGQLAAVSGNGNNYDLSYDALGRCIKRVLNNVTTYYTYDGSHPIYEWKADGTRAGWNLYGKGVDEILLRADFQVLSNGQGYFFQQNKLGSVTHLTGFAGEVIERYRYDAFGQPTTVYTGGVFNNRFKFTGREYQEVFGIYEYRNRAYHPGLGRFLSEDPLEFKAGDTNFFRYCGGDPVNRTDPSGMSSPEVMKKNEAMGNAVTVVGSPVGPPADFSPNSNGFTQVTDRNGGLAALNQGGGFNSFRGGGGGGSVPRLYRDSGRLGATPAIPPGSVTQGWWTDMEGFYVGNAWVLYLPDEQLFSILNAVYKNVSAAHLKEMTFSDWVAYMRTLNIPEFYNTRMFSYTGVLQALHGVFSGHEINYIGVGMGFAARGVSMEDMVTWIYGWKDLQYLWYGITDRSRLPYAGIHGGEWMWADLGYVYYMNGGHL